MALSSENKYRVIFALGLPGEVLNESSMHFNSLVRDRLGIENEFAEARVLALLDEVDAVKEQLRKSPKNSNLKRIGDLEFDTDKSHLLIRKELARILEELAKLLMLPNRGSKGQNVSVVL